MRGNDAQIFKMANKRSIDICLCWQMGNNARITTFDIVYLKSVYFENMISCDHISILHKRRLFCAITIPKNIEKYQTGIIT